MRWIAPLLLLAFLPSAAAHGGMGHLSVEVEDYAPGQTVVSTIDGGNEGPLRKGWVFALGSIVQAPGRLEVSLARDGAVSDRYVWEDGVTHFNTTRLVVDEYVDVRIHNPTNQTVRAGFYFDQSCNCAGKTIPLPMGTVLFNYKFPAKGQVHIEVPILEGWGVDAVIATLPPNGKTWPTDFDVLVRSNKTTPGMLKFDFRTAEAGEYFLIITATQGVVFPPEPGKEFELTPLVEVTEGGGSPAPSVLVAALAAASVTVWRRRRG